MENMNASVALQQIGTMNLARIGARTFVGGGPGLHFNVGRGNARKIEITLEPDDTYSVRLWNVRTMAILSEVETVYAESLGAVVVALVEKGGVS